MLNEWNLNLSLKLPVINNAGIYKEQELKRKKEFIIQWIIESNENSNNQELIRTIDKNYPILKLLKEFQNWWEYNAMIFTWIKALNDLNWQFFTDIILAKFKSQIQQNNTLWLKIVFDDYKNFIIAKSDGSDLNLWDEKNLQNILNVIFEKSLKTHFPWKELKNPIQVFSQIWKIEKNVSQVQIATEIAKTRSNLEKKAIQKENINIANNFYEIIDKEKEIYNKYCNNSFYEFTEEDGIKYEVLSWILTKTFKINWKQVTERTRIFERENWDPKWKIILTLNIMNLIKKWEISKKLQLYQDINSFIRSCIIYWEFIMPIDKNYDLFSKWELVEKDLFDRYNKLISKIQSWQNIDKNDDFITKTYKNALNKNSFYQDIKEEWQLFFIDIKWMWVENIRDFFNVIKEVSENKDLTEDQKIDYIFLHSWDVMTNKIKKFKKFIIQYFWDNTKMYIWWDEIMFFTKNKKKDYKNIFQEAQNLWLNIRLTTKDLTKSNLNSSWKNIKELDGLTKFSKILEKRIDLLKETMELNKLKWDDYTSPFNSLKDFILFTENWDIKINFINNPFDWKNIFNVWEIINLEKEKLLQNSILTKFLEEKFKIKKS